MGYSGCPPVTCVWVHDSQDSSGHLVDPTDGWRIVERPTPPDPQQEFGLMVPYLEGNAALTVGSLAGVHRKFSGKCSKE